MRSSLLQAALLLPLGLATITAADSTTGLGCDTDCNQDGQVNVDDLLDVIASWGENGCDVNGDGITNVNELLALLAEWGSPCHPFLTDHPLGLTVEFNYDAGFAIISATGLAQHPMGPFDGSTGCFNPNTPSNQNDEWMIPLFPTPTGNPAVNVLDQLGPIGIAYNGVAFYNPYDGGTMEAPGNICMDDFYGHPSPDGRYHYHQNSPYEGDDGSGHSPIVGYAFDGIPIYGPWDAPGVLAAVSENPLDDCNGHFDAVHGYHYHSISYDLAVKHGLPGEGFPWVIGCYYAEPELSNFDGDGGPPPPPGGCDGCAANMIPPPICNCVHTTPGYEYCCENWDANCQAYADEFCNEGPP